MSRGVSRRAFIRRASMGAATAVLGTQIRRLDHGRGALAGNASSLPWMGRSEPALPAPVPPVLTGAPSTPAIVTRAEWGADESIRRSEVAFSPPRKIVVHHTALVSTGDFAADVREVYRLHLTRDGASWTDIGYHYLIDPEGRVYEGRWARDYADGDAHDGHDVFGRVVRGSHAMAFNTGTLGIALMGNFDGARPSDAALASLVHLTAWLCARHALDPNGAEPFVDANNVARSLPNIIGHRDVRHTACPGSVGYAVIPEIRARVAEELARASAPEGPGYRILHADGTIASRALGDLGDPVRAGAASGGFVGACGGPGGGSLWVADHQGGVFTFGSAPYQGSVPSLREAGRAGAISAVGVAATPGGDGYWIVDRDGGVYAFGGAPFHGSIPQRRAEGSAIPPVRATAVATTPTGGGYWIIDREGGVFTFGDAPYRGSVPELRGGGVTTDDVAAVDIAPTATGNGYWILDRRGGVFAFGDAGYHGSVPEAGFPGAPAVRIQGAPGGGGYLVLCDDGAVLRFGDAPFAGHGPRLDAVDLVMA